MKKSKFIKSTVILMIGGLITKILGMLIKIVVTRSIPTEGMGLYMLINPTFMLLIAISTLGLPTAISKIISEDKKNNKNIIFSSLILILLINLILMLIIFISSKFIAYNLLKEPRTYYSLISLAFILPFISISSILRGYFFGKEKVFPHVLSNILEDITKLITIIFFIPFFLIKGLEFAIAFVVLSNIISEITSIITLLLFLPKKIKVTKNDLKLNKENIFSILDISLPTTGSRLLGSIGYFFEPIIVTNILLYTGFTSEFILNEYGILTGYVVPLILLPSFFTFAISQALLPVISNAYSNNKKEYLFKKLKQAIFFSLLIGIPATLVFTFIPHIPLQIVFNTNQGINYIKILAPLFLIFYIQAPLTSCMQGMNLAKQAMFGTLIGIIIKLIILIISTYFIGLWGMVLASAINVTIVTAHHIICIKKKLRTMS